MGKCIAHEPCPKCGSRDNLARWADGGATCMTPQCGYWEHKDGGRVAEQQVKDWTPIRGSYQDLPKRGLKRETLEFWRYQTNDDGVPCHIANYYDPDSGELVAQKLRRPNKQFSINGNGRSLPLYGQSLWQPGGKHLTIVEGEIDALSVSQAFDNKYAVVSIPNGAGGAEMAVAKAYKWIDTFGRIVLMFDADEPGRKATASVAPLLPPGKVCIAKLPEKDANAVLVKHGPGAIVNAFWKAAPWCPDGIIEGSSIPLEDLMRGASAGYPFPWPRLQARVLGVRKGELTLWTAGSGIGKSTVVRELGYSLLMDHGCKIGNVFLEEPNLKTAQGYVAIHNNIPLGRLRFTPSLLSPDQWLASRQQTIDRMFFDQHFGSVDSTKLISRIRYMAVVGKADFVLLDHVSIVTSGLESSKEGERKDIDILMTRLRSLIEETGIGIIAVVHLKRTDRNFNEGDAVSLSDLRGSASLEQLSDNVLALERDQQSDQPTRMLVRVLKCRETGETGEADTLDYNRETGRIEIATDLEEVLS